MKNLNETQMIELAKAMITNGMRSKGEKILNDIHLRLARKHGLKVACEFMASKGFTNF